MQSIKRYKKQSGMTLMEVLASLGILALVVIGALALYSQASTSQKSTELQSNLQAFRQGIQQMYKGSYGSASLNGALVTAKKVPSTWSGSGTSINHQIDSGAVIATGATSSFRVSLGSIPVEVCVDLLTGAGTSWSSIRAGTADNTGGTLRTTPVSAADATTDCTATNNVITFYN